MNAGTTLKWRGYPIGIERRDALRSLTGRSFDPTGLAPAALPDLDNRIQLPDLPEAPIDKAVTLLRVAAQIEHALMVQYLYASYSFKPKQQVIAGVAIEEMSHLMTVQNLLRCIGQAPYLGRQDYDPPRHRDERLFPFDLRLEPVSHVSLAKYVVAESPDPAPPDVDPAVLAHIRDLATTPESVNRVGMLYALLAAVFGSEELLRELAADGDAWYMMVNDFAVEAAQRYGGRDKLHLPDGAFQPGSASAQASDPEWDRSVEGDLDEFRVFVVADRRQALDALRDIGLQGEGPSPVAMETSHFRRFYELFVTFFGRDGMGTNPPSGVQNVPAGPRIVLDPGGSGGNVISHPTTIRWARLADLRYAILLGSLERYLRAPTDDRAFLRGWCFADMFALKKLAEFLAAMPRGNGDASEVAAVPFTLPGWLETGPQWSDLAEAFGASIAIAESLRDEVGVPADRQRLLVLLLASDERKRAEATARTQGRTQRTRTDAVRDVLDWAAGAGDPRGAHGRHSRFWNLQHAELIEVTTSGGENITAPPSPGVDAPIVQKLRDQEMPQDRPKLAPESEEFKAVERWVADGRPDDSA